MKLLLTGGLGHIGSYFLQKIYKIKKIKELYVIDNFLTNRYSSLFNLQNRGVKIFFLEKDLSKKDSLNNFPRVDFVINLASITDAENSFKIKKIIYQNNLGIFRNIINYCKKNSSKLIHISSTSVYGDQINNIVDESCKTLKPQSPYAKIKIQEENMLKNQNKINYTTYRFGTIAGVSNGMRFHTAINKFCLNAVIKKPIPIWKGMLNKERPFLSLNEAFRVIKFTIERNFFNNQIYNIVSQNLELNKIIKFLKKNIKNIKINFVDSKLVNYSSYKISCQKFNSKAFKLNAKIFKDITATLKIFKNINNAL